MVQVMGGGVVEIANAVVRQLSSTITVANFTVQLAFDQARIQDSTTGGGGKAQFLPTGAKTP